jgi:class 3 adenylate cyclase
MNTQEVKRKLTAILSADVKGYSRLMGEDEKATGGEGSRVRNEIPMIRSRWGIELFHFLV